MIKNEDQERTFRMPTLFKVNHVTGEIYPVACGRAATGEVDAEGDEISSLTHFATERIARHSTLLFEEAHLETPFVYVMPGELLLRIMDCLPEEMKAEVLHGVSAVCVRTALREADILEIFRIVTTEAMDENRPLPGAFEIEVAFVETMREWFAERTDTMVRLELHQAVEDRLWKRE